MLNPVDMETNKIIIAKPSDGEFIKEFLYHAIWVPEKYRPVARDILNDPRITVYYLDWGKPYDYGLFAKNGSRFVGAVWIRLFDKEHPGFGFVDEETPELSISILPEFRGLGIGSLLMHRILTDLSDKYRRICLSVSKENPARSLYLRFGFYDYEKEGDSFLMVKVL